MHKGQSEADKLFFLYQQQRVSFHRPSHLISQVMYMPEEYIKIFNNENEESK